MLLIWHYPPATQTLIGHMALPSYSTYDIQCISCKAKSGGDSIAFVNILKCTICTMVGLTTMLNWRFDFNICQHAQQYPTKCTHLALIILSPYRHNTHIHIILFTKFITSQTVAYQLHHRNCQLKPQSHSSLSVTPPQLSTKAPVTQ